VARNAAKHFETFYFHFLYKLVALWPRERQEATAQPPSVGNLSGNIFLLGKFLSKNAKFGTENAHFLEKFGGKIDILSAMLEICNCILSELC